MRGMDKIAYSIGRHAPRWLVQFVGEYPVASFFAFILTGAIVGALLLYSAGRLYLALRSG